MTEPSTESLIAESRKVAEEHDPAFRFVLTRVIDRLEEVAKDSAEGQHQHAYWQQRAEEAENQSRMNDRAFRYAVNGRVGAEQERDALAAIVEKVRDEVERAGGVDVTSMNLLPVLATAPADALREVKAEVWVSGYGAGLKFGLVGKQTVNPYRSHACAEDAGRGEYCQACGQKREEQS